MIGDNELQNAQGPNAVGCKEMVKNETTDEDNFAIVWTTNSGEFGFKSRETCFRSRKTFGDKVFSCSRVFSDKEGHECVMKVCASLKAK